MPYQYNLMELAIKIPKQSRPVQRGESVRIIIYVWAYAYQSSSCEAFERRHTQQVRIARQNFSINNTRLSMILAVHPPGLPNLVCVIQLEQVFERRFPDFFSYIYQEQRLYQYQATISQPPRTEAGAMA